MDRTSALDNVARRFSDGNPQAGQNATIVGAQWLNGVQEEIVHAIEASAQVPSDADQYQLKKAVQFLGGNGSLAGAGWFKIGGGLIVQWGTVRTTYITEQVVSVTFPTTFPVICAAFLPVGFGGPTSDFNALSNARTTSGAQVTINSVNAGTNPLLEGFDYIAVGY